MTGIIALLDLALNILWWVVIVHALMSWLIGMQVLNLNHEFIKSIWFSLERLLEPVYSKIREFLPRTGVIDLSPLVLIFGIILIRQLLITI